MIQSVSVIRLGHDTQFCMPVVKTLGAKACMRLNNTAISTSCREPFLRNKCSRCLICSHQGERKITEAIEAPHESR